MGTLEQIPGLRREYELNSLTKGIYTLLGVAFAGGGIFGAWKITPLPGSGVLASVFALVPTAMGVFILAYAFRSRLIIDGPRITVRSAFTEKSADLSEVEGFRTFSSRNGSYQRIYLKGGRDVITLTSAFSTDEAFAAWFRRVPDLDERDRKVLLDEIAQQQDLGATPEERLGALGMAKAWSIALIVVSILLGCVILFSNDAVSLSTVRYCLVLLALVPLAGAWLVRSSPLLYTIFKKKKDPRGDVGWTIFIAGLGCIFRTTGVHFVSIESMILYMAIVATVVVAIYFGAANSGARNVWAALVMFAGFYGYGVIAAADVVFDNSAAEPYSAVVVGGHVSRGRSTTYYLRLAPWGPIDHEKDVSVNYTVYHHAHLGDAVCATLHNGSLRAPWFRVASCEDQSVPQNTAPSDLPQ